MNAKLIVIFLLACPFILGDNATKMHNIGYVSNGYNIYKGNPLANGIDPGFTRPIFQFKYEGKVSADGRYELPKGVDIGPQNSCNLRVHSEEITNEKGYADKLHTYVSVSGESCGASFGFSADYQKIKQERKKKEYVHIITTGECIVYEAKLHPYVIPALDEDFKTSLKKLPENYTHATRDTYFEFLDAYGTHYITEASMGSRMTTIFSLTETDRAELYSRSIDIKAAASASFFSLATVKTSAGVSKETKNTDHFHSKVKDTKEHYIGSTPSNGGVIGWTNQKINEPMPIKYSMAPLYSIINNENKDFSGADVSKIQAISLNIRQASEEYCKGHLKKHNSEQSCDAPFETAETPSNNQCALCAQECGGMFSVEAGTLASGTNSEHFLTFASGCSGKIDQHPLDKEGAKICCMPNNTVSTGSCKLCETCGGKYNHHAGRVAIGLTKDDWVKSAGPKCSENIRARDLNDHGFNLCCSKKEMCSLCTTCGGSYPKELGVMGIREPNKNKYESRGKECGGELEQGRHYTDGLRLCCNHRSLEKTPTDHHLFLQTVLTPRRYEKALEM